MNEDKDLLLKDLSARLPYGVIFKDEFDENLQEIHYIKNEDIFSKNYPHLPYWIENIKPYLRPMSSMTKEELIEFNNIPRTKNYKILNDLPWDVANYKQIAWLLEHHFDFMGLIPKGLAIKVTEENNPYGK